MEAGWTTVPCPETNLGILIGKSSARTKRRPDDNIGFTPSCPPTFYKIAPMDDYLYYIFNKLKSTDITIYK